jgi:hypothetical protein
VLDLELTKDGDLNVRSTGSVKLTNSVCQAVNIRLKWFLGEWVFNTELGTPYIPIPASRETNQTYILGKNPNINLIRSIIHKRIMSVKEVERVERIDISVDKQTRKGEISYVIWTNLGSLEGEVSIYG